MVDPRDPFREGEGSGQRNRRFTPQSLYPNSEEGQDPPHGRDYHPMAPSHPFPLTPTGSLGIRVVPYKRTRVSRPG